MKRSQREKGKHDKLGHKPKGFISPYAAKLLARQNGGAGDNSRHPNRLANIKKEEKPEARPNILSQVKIVSPWPDPDLYSPINRCFFVILQPDAPRPVILTIQASFSGHSVELPRYNNFNGRSSKCEGICNFGLSKTLTTLADREGPESGFVCLAGNHYPPSRTDPKINRVWCLALARLNPTSRFPAIRGAETIVRWEVLSPELIEVMKPSHTLPIIYATNSMKSVFPKSDSYLDEIRLAAVGRQKEFLGY